MKNLVTLRFMLVLLFAIMSMTVSAVILGTGDGFMYRLDTEAKTAELAGYNGSATEVSISESVTYKGVVYSVTSLGEKCFYNCSSLTSINIPSSVTSLGKECFFYCSSLKTVTCEIPAPIGNNDIFFGAPINGATLYVPEASLNSYKTTLPWSGFGTILAIKSSGIETTDIIEYSTDDGFKYRLDTEAKTAELADYNGSATEVSISESVTYGGVVYSVTSLGGWCFSHCSSLTSINIPSSVTSLGYNCFYDCRSLASINIPSSVTSLGGGCFYLCSSLTSINIPSSVTSLGECCFYYCYSLTSINIPSSVTSLGGGCFYGCI